MSPIQITKINNFEFREKICALDYDWTLVKPKTNGTFSKNIDDWQLLNPNIPDILKEYYNKNYCLIVFTNQTKSWKQEQIHNVISSFNLPFMIVIATDLQDKKPSTNMFDLVSKDQDIDKEHSFFVGDALGRPNDFADSDKQFAINIGVNWRSPEEMFPFTSKDIANIQLSTEKEIVIMVGFPGSGKSTIVNNIFNNNGNYTIISGDELKTASKIKKTSIKELENGKSIVIDATNATKEKRLIFIELAKKYNYSIRCIYVSTSMEESMARNNQRSTDKIVPKIVYYVYKKNFKLPTIDEGFTQIITI